MCSVTTVTSSSRRSAAWKLATTWKLAATPRLTVVRWTRPKLELASRLITWCRSPITSASAEIRSWRPKWGFPAAARLAAQVLIGGQVGIAPHCTLEDDAIIGAQAGIPSGKTIRRGQTVWGTPARPFARFKEQYGWLSRLPELAERVRKLEEEKAVE